MRKLKLLIAACALFGVSAAYAQTPVPFLKEKNSFGTAVSQLSTFVPGTGTTYTLELTGCTAGSEITVLGGSFSYTPTADGPVRFVRNGGDVVYVYEGTTYKGTVTVSAPADPTYPTELTSASTENLIQNGGFEDTSAGTYSGQSSRWLPTHWSPYNKNKEASGNGTSVRNGSPIEGTYAMLMHDYGDGFYLTQQLASGIMKNFTPYQISYKYKANTDGQKGAKYMFQVGNAEFNTDYFSSSECNASTTSIQVFSTTFITPATVVDQPYVQLFRSTDTDAANLDYFDEFILVAATGGGIGITGATGATFLSGTAYAPEGLITATLEGGPIDVTSCVTNPNFDSDIKGWTAPSGGAKLANNKTDQTTNFYETWNADPKQGRMYQVLEGLPQGTYKLKVFAFADQKGTMTPANTDVCVYAQGQEVGTTSSSHIHRNYVNSTDFTYYETWAYVDATGKLEIGMRQDVATFRWLGMDNVTLQYVSSENQEDALLLAELQTKWNSIITDWNDNVLNGATYANIKGVERATFATEMATATAASITTIADYKTNATADLANAYLGFINPDVKTSYDNLAAAITAAEAAGVDATAAKAVRDAAETTAAAAQNAATLLNNTVEVKDATTTVPVVTDFVINGTFDENVNGWTSTGGFQNTGLKDAISGTLNKFWENWNPSAKVNKMYQTINNIPNGTYRLDISAFASVLDGDNSYVFANNDKTSLTDDATTGADYQVYTVVTNNTIEIGLEQTTATAEWMGIDNVSLRYYGAGDVVNEAKFGSHKYDYDQALIAATDALADANYTNVIGSEREALQTEVEKSEPTTTDGYDQATLDLTAKTSTFVQAKGNYDDLVAEIAKAKALGIAEATANGYAAIASSTAATALTSTQNLKVAEYNYVKTNYPKDFTSHYLASPTTNNFGSTSGQHWDGKEDDPKTSYFDSWSGSAADKELTYKITLPEGRYVIMAAGRGQATSSTSLYMSDGTNNEYFTMKNDTGLGINKKGVASFDPDDTEGFANTTGRGWEWRYLLLELTEEETEVTLSLRGNINNSWVGACNFTLLTTADNVAINKATYKTALAAAEAARDDDSYNNVIGSERTELLAAIATDVSANTEQAYDDAAAALEGATTTFKAAKAAYDAFVAAKAVEYDDNLPYASATKFAAIATAQAAADATSADDATTKTDEIFSAYRKYVESNALAEGVDGAEDKTTLITDPNMDVTYDGTAHTFGAWEVIGQTNGDIKLLNSESFTDGDGNSNYKYADIWKSDNNAGIQQTINLPAGKYMLTVTARANTTAGAAFWVFAGSKKADIQRIGNSGGVFNRGWNDASVEFVVNETSDVNIGVQSGNGKNLWWSATRFRLVQLPTPSITISENDDAAPTAQPIANVTLTRTLSASNWNTFSVPFDIAIPDGWTVKEFDSVDDVDENVINFKDATTIKAGEPYLVKPAADVANPTYNNVEVKSTEGETKGTGGYKFAAQIYNDTSLPTDGTIAYLATDNSIKKLTSGSIKGLRAYFIVPASGSTARITFVDGDASGIGEITEQGVANDGKVYDLSGRRVETMKKGIYVVNGKKVVK